MKNIVNELVKNFDDISFEEYSRNSSEKEENVLFNFWYKSNVGTLRISHFGDQIYTVVLDIPGNRIETLRTNTKLEKLAKKVLKNSKKQ